MSDSQGVGWLKDVLKDLDPSQICDNVDSCVKYFNDLMRKTNPGAVLTEKGTSLLLSRDDNATKVLGFRWLLEHIRPSTSFTWTNADIGKFEPGQVWLDPVSIKDLKDNQNETEIRKRMSDETTIGSHVGMKGYLFCVLHVLPNLGADNVFIRWLKTYIQHCDPVNMDPYADGHKEALLNPLGDTHVRLRIFTLIQLAFYSHCFPQISMEIWIEVGKFLFDSPHRRTSELKSLINVHRQSAFCNSKTGTYLNHGTWRGQRVEVVGRGEYVPVMKEADPLYYEANKKYLDEKIVEMKEKGFTHLPSLLNELVSAPFNDEWIAVATSLYTLEAIAGYTRSETLAAHLEQVGGEFPEYTGSYDSYLRAFWGRFVEFAANKLPTYQEFKAMVASSWTSRSSGGWSYRVRVKIDELSKFTSVRKIAKDGTVEFKFGDKRMVFLRAGFELLRPELIKKGYSVDESPEILGEWVQYFSDTLEGKVGARDVVGGKKRRAIIAQRGEHMAAAEAYAYLLQEFQESLDEFSIGNQRGNPVDDHKDTLVITGQKDDEEVEGYILGADYEKFDASEKEANARGPDRRHLTDALRKRGLTAPFGPWKDMSELIETIWGKGVGYDTVFRFGTGDNVQLVTLDQLLSGELMTLSLNNVHNLANIQNAVAKFESLPAAERLRIVYYVMMGDDSQQFVMALSSVTLADYKLLIQNMIDTSAANGFKINWLKAVFRKRYGEYLKVRFIGGREIPLLQIQPMGKERVDDVLHPRDQFSAIYGLFNTCVSRGFPHDTMYKLFFMLWLWKRNMKLYRQARRGSITHNLLYLNVWLLWLPKSLGGIGVYPGSLIGASTDMLILLRCVEDSNLKKNLDRAAFEISADGATDIKRIVANALMKDGEYIAPDGSVGKKGHVFDKGMEAYQEVMIAERIRASKKLAKKYPHLADRAYHRMGERALMYSLTSDEKLVSLASAARLSNSDAIWAKCQEEGTVDVLQDYAWMKSFRYVKVGELDVLDGTNLRPILGWKMRRALQVFGHSGNPDEIAVKLPKIFAPLSSDLFFPREWSAEALANMLFRKEVLSNRDYMYDILVLLGARKDLATRVVESVMKSADSFSFVSGLPGFSKNDQTMVLFDLSRNAHVRVVKVYDMPDQKVVNFLLQLGFFKSFLDGFHTGKYPMLRVELGSTAYSDFAALMHSWYTVPGKVVDIIPRKEWEFAGQD